MWTTYIVKTFWKCSGVDQWKETDRPDSPPALFRFSTLLQCLGPKRQKNKKIQKRQFAKLHFYLSRWSSGANGHRYDSLSSKQNKTKKREPVVLFLPRMKRIEAGFFFFCTGEPSEAGGKRLCLTRAKRCLIQAHCWIPVTFPWFT